MERLQKMIANSGYTSRRKAEELILNGQVKVNGKVVDTLGVQVNSNDEIMIDNKILTREKKEYYLLNKPSGYISSVSDEENRKVIVDLIGTSARIYPVGRLDYDTTGLIILTNDGELANILMHPKNKVEKVYLAKIEGKLAMEELFKLKNGVLIDGRKAIPNKVKIRKYNQDKNTSLVEISISEGRNHIIKKILKAVGHDVIKLTRIKYGFLEIGNLQSGEYRILDKKEVHKLYSYQVK